MNEKQKELYIFIKEFIIKNGYSPSYQEMKQGINAKSNDTIFRRVRELKEKGYINYKENTTRTIRIIK